MPGCHMIDQHAVRTGGAANRHLCPLGNWAQVLSTGTALRQGTAKYGQSTPGGLNVRNGAAVLAHDDAEERAPLPMAAQRTAHDLRVV